MLRGKETERNWQSSTAHFLASSLDDHQHQSSSSVFTLMGVGVGGGWHFLKNAGVPLYRGCSGVLALWLVERPTMASGASLAALRAVVACSVLSDKD